MQLPKKIEDSKRFVWIVGRSNESSWELLGIYDNEKTALQRIKTHNDFIGPVELNQDLPNEIVDWPNLLFPIEAQEPA